jgi:hypothetical protein
MSTPDGSTNLTDDQKAETADASASPPDTASGGAPEPAADDDITTEEDGTPVENPSG